MMDWISWLEKRLDNVRPYTGLELEGIRDGKDPGHPEKGNPAMVGCETRFAS